jgi:hypothetical protein
MIKEVWRMRAFLVRALVGSALVCAVSISAAGTAAAEQIDCAKASRGYDWALANLVVSDSYITQAYYRGFEDYYDEQMTRGGC